MTWDTISLSTASTIGNPIEHLMSRSVPRIRIEHRPEFNDYKIIMRW